MGLGEAGTIGTEGQRQGTVNEEIGRLGWVWGGRNQAEALATQPCVTDILASLHLEPSSALWP